MNAIRLEVVVLPCAPATAMTRLPSISRATISARRMTGMPRRRPSAISGLSSADCRRMDEERRIADVRGRVAFDERRRPSPRGGRSGRDRRRSLPETATPRSQQELGDGRHVHAADADEVDRAAGCRSFPRDLQQRRLRLPMAASGRARLRGGGAHGIEPGRSRPAARWMRAPREPSSGSSTMDAPRRPARAIGRCRAGDRRRTCPG